MGCNLLPNAEEKKQAYLGSGSARLTRCCLSIGVAPLLLAIQALAWAPPGSKSKMGANDQRTSQIDRLLAMPLSNANAGMMSPGSTYAVDGSLADLGADFRARHLGDVQ